MKKVTAFRLKNKTTGFYLTCLIGHKIPATKKTGTMYTRIPYFMQEGPIIKISEIKALVSELLEYNHHNILNNLELEEFKVEIKQTTNTIVFNDIVDEIKQELMFDELRGIV